MRTALLQSILTVWVCTFAASAQQKEDHRPAQPVNASTQQSASEGGKSISPQPSPEIGRLIKVFSGTWSIAVKIEPNERMPKGGTGRGENLWRPGPGRLSLIGEYHSTGSEGEFSGLGLVWWDKDGKRYQIMWCDSSDPASCIVLKNGAKWEGGQLIAIGESASTGRKFVFKEVFSEITENSFTQTLYRGESSSDLRRLLTITATRKTTPGGSEPDVFTLRSPQQQLQRLNMPGPAVQNSMLGKWSLSLKYEASPEMPKGAMGRATEVWWAGPGGYSMVEEYYQSDANEHAEEFSPAWWDTQAGGQRFVYCGNTQPDGCYVPKNVFRWEGTSLVYSDEREQEGKKVARSLVFTDITPDSFTEITQEGEAGKPLKPTLTMHATRLPAPGQ